MYYKNLDFGSLRAYQNRIIQAPLYFQSHTSKMRCGDIESYIIGLKYWGCRFRHVSVPFQEIFSGLLKQRIEMGTSFAFAAQEIVWISIFAA